MIGERMLLKEFIRDTLIILEDDGAGARLDAEELEAKTAYEKAKQELDQWRAESAKKVAFLHRSKELGISPEGDAARKLKSDQRFNYDAKVLQKKEGTLLKTLEKAKQEWGAYDPSVIDYARVSSTSAAKTSGAAIPPEKGTKVYVAVSDIRPLQWYEWSDERWTKVVKGVAMGNTKDKSGDEKTGVGPGEERLAKIFGGRVQGGSVSFDIVTPDERRWEVKSLDNASDLIRPGTEGRIAFEKPAKRLEKIMGSMKNFVAVSKKLDLGDVVTDEEKKVIDFVEGFVDDSFDMIVGKGEVAIDRFKALRAALNSVSKMKKRWEALGAEPKMNTVIGLAGKEVQVDKPTYVDVVKRVKRAVPDADVFSGIEQHEFLLATLRDGAFDDPRVFFDEWFESVDINRIFSQVDGVFIVNNHGFSMVPKGLFKKAFRFKKVSQKMPKFEYVYYNASSNDEQST